MFDKGDHVTVIDTTGQNPKTLGRSGTVTDITPDNELVAVKGIDNPIVEAILGERGYRPDQLRKN